MRRRRFTEEQIIGILKEHEAGIPVSDLCRKHGVSDASIYKWKARFGGMDVSEAKRLKVLMMDEARKQMARVAKDQAEQPDDPVDARLVLEGDDEAGEVHLDLQAGRGLKAELERSRPCSWPKRGTVSNFVYGRRFEHQAWRAFVKRSPKMMAN